MQDVFETIALLHGCKRIENFLSEEFDVSVYAVRQWTTRGVPIRLRERLAHLAGMSVDALNDMHYPLL
jgi:hypothetical protein